LLRSVGAVKDAAVRGAEAQRVWIDGALLGRKRRDVLAELGEKIYEGVVSGALRDLEGHPELAELIAEIDDLDVRMQEAAERTRETTDRARRTAAGFAARAGFPATGLSRRRPTEDRDEVAQRPRVWRPVMPSIMADEDDGTVSALSQPEQNPFDDAPATAAERPAANVARPQRQRRAARGRGGIQFVEDPVPGDPEDDADLEQYMHPDDVPDETP
jgi:hypothetical protein